MDDYKQYLAQKLFTEDQLVTYRLLSRALGIHVNRAKEMLYDFHKWQNEKKPSAVYATYVVYGTKSSRPAKPETDGEDVEMTDSQMSVDDAFDAPYIDMVPSYTLSLVRQEDLDEALSQYTEVTAIHVYSLAPHPLKDLQILTDVGKQVKKLSKPDRDLKPAKIYGTIVNHSMVRRERRKASPKPAVVKPETTTPAVKPEPEKPKPKTAAERLAAAAAAKKPVPAAASLKRQGSSGIGQMFAKAAANPKKLKKAEEVPAKNKKEEEATGAMSDDGEDDSTEPMEGVKKTSDEASGTARAARKAREAELQAMMEESDEEEEEKEEADPMDDEPEPEPEAEVEAEMEVETDAKGGNGKQESDEKEEQEVVAGRRRGRRRVTKKKQIMDEKGYLVTIQEQGWESFSEDEAPPPKPKIEVKPKPKQEETTAAAAVKSEPAAGGGKGKKSAAAKGGQAGQGNIMSFFSKK
ncbi:DNA polymerase subunit Cdc27 [Astrocystis sublimbata]|nr:DNA polymerase subunit Cdc27 [Astrocystis sublimbata]